MNFNSAHSHQPLHQHAHPNTHHNSHTINSANAIVPQATSQYSIPIKIYDGLFMADHYIAQDTQFFQTNLITHVINCAGQEVQNNNKISGVAFLTFQWSENVVQNITEQKIISVTVNFIEECRKQSGCLLINFGNSQSRPFCLLACYFMVRFKWSLFKTLEFLNSRKEDVELEPAFFEQLTAFAQKLQDKGLIRSKTWVISPGMSDEEIVITNTYLNSKNKFGTASPHPSSMNRMKNKNTVNWKKQLVIQHVYCPNSAICEKVDKPQKQRNIFEKNNQKIQKQAQRKSLIQPSRPEKNPHNSRQKRQDSLKKNQKQSSQSVLQPHKSNTPQSQSQQQSSNQPSQKQRTSASNSLTQMNVTRKWAQLRQMWLRQKQNHNAGNSFNGKGKLYYYSEVSQKQQTPIIVKKEEQKINDRLQEKLNILKRHEHKLQIDNPRPSNNNNKKQHSDILQLQRNLPGTIYQPDRTYLNTLQSKPISATSSHHNSHQLQGQSHAQLQHNHNHNQNHNHSRIVHNNWIIDNHQVVGVGSTGIGIGGNGGNNNGDVTGHRSSKNKLSANGSSNGNIHGNKSVIIVKPNHGSSSLDVKDNRSNVSNNNNISNLAENRMKDSGMFNSGQRGNSSSNNNNNNNNGHASRSSLRKIAGSDRKQQNNSSLNKQSSGTAKFFRNQATDIISTKGRCSSAKPQRKQNPAATAIGLGLTKNGSLKGKGKWKF